MIIKLLDGRRYEARPVWSSLDAQVHVLPFQEGMLGEEPAPVSRYVVARYIGVLWEDAKEIHSLPTELEAISWAKRLHGQHAQQGKK